MLLAEGKWKVWVTTNEMPAAGTHAQVTLTAYGSKGNSGPIPLGYADGETFQAGNIDEFEVCCAYQLKAFWNTCINKSEEYLKSVDVRVSTTCG